MNGLVLIVRNAKTLHRVALAELSPPVPSASECKLNGALLGFFIGNIEKNYLIFLSICLTPRILAREALELFLNLGANAIPVLPELRISPRADYA